MTRLVLHLGLPRTGTTSIQSFLASQRAALLDAGILYPEPSGATPRHRNFERTALNRDAATAINHVALAMELLDTDRNLTDRRGPAPGWTAALERMAADGLDTLLVSYENFALAPARYDLSRIEAPLAGYERTGILYLRHPQDWLVSLYEQHIRGKRRGAVPFAEFGQFERAARLTSLRRVRAAGRAFGLDRTVALDFTAAARDGGLIPSFLDAAGIAHALQPDGDVHRNASLPAWATLFLRECNRRGLSDALFVRLRGILARPDAAEAVDLAPGLDLLTAAERTDLARIAAADVAELEDGSGLRLLGPRPASAGEARAFADADFRTVAAAVPTLELDTELSPELVAELTDAAG